DGTDCVAKLAGPLRVTLADADEIGAAPGDLDVVLPRHGDHHRGTRAAAGGAAGRGQGGRVVGGQVQPGPGALRAAGLRELAVDEVQVRPGAHTRDDPGGAVRRDAAGGGDRVEPVVPAHRAVGTE